MDQEHLLWKEFFHIEKLRQSSEGPSRRAFAGQQLAVAKDILALQDARQAPSKRAGVEQRQVIEQLEEVRRQAEDDLTRRQLGTAEAFLSGFKQQHLLVFVKWGAPSTPIRLAQAGAVALLLFGLLSGVAGLPALPVLIVCFLVAIYAASLLTKRDVTGSIEDARKLHATQA